MKQQFPLFISLLALATLSFIDPPNKLTGRWQMKMPPGTSAIMAFRADNTIDVFLNGKNFVSGQYWFRHDTVAYIDPTCGNGYHGLYRVAFVGDDSVRLTFLQDTCIGRRQFITGAPMMGRLKPTKP